MPVNDFCVVDRQLKETGQFKEILEDIKTYTSVIFHIYGFPGTGKTTLLQKLGNQFPFGDFDETVKYHIECNSIGYDLKSGLEDLMRQVDVSKTQVVVNELNKNKSNNLVDILYNCEKHFLIVIEDVQPISYKLFADFLRNVDKKSNQYAKYKFHVYIATRKNNVGILDQADTDLSNFKFKELKGFTEDEGIEYLIGERNNFEENKNAAQTICKRFSGSPLGLLAAKKFCKEVEIDYITYNQNYSLDSQYVTMEENNFLLDTYGKSFQHVFHAITMPFLESDTFYWKVMSCLAYMHHVNIPEKIVTAICRLLGAKNDKSKLKIKVGKLSSELKHYGMCKIEKRNDSVFFNFHEVVLHAFRYNPCLDPLKEMVFAMSTLITKDIRDKTSSLHMKNLFPHLHSLLEHYKAKDNTDNPVFSKKEGSGFDFDWVLNELVLANLLEVFGSVAQSSSFVFENQCESYLDMAINKIWNIINYLTQNKNSHKKFNTLRNAEKNIDQETELCQIAGENLPAGFIADYEAKVISYQIRSQLDFLQSECTKQNPLNDAKFQQFQQNLEKYSVLDNKQIEVLRECSIFLSEEDHRKMFFLERLALILHSRSRISIYKDFDQNIDYKSHKLDAYCAFQFAERCERNNATILTQFLSRTSGYYPQVLKENNICELTKARLKCQDEIKLGKSDVPIHMYEHGVIKEWRSVKHQIPLFCYLVEINTKLFETLKCDESFVKESTDSCNELLNILTENVTKEYSIIPKSFVHCAKFYSLLDDKVKTVECFNKFLKMKTQRPDEYNWAMLQYAKAVEVGRIQDKVNFVTDECKKILTLPMHLNQKILTGLREVLEKLDARDW